jgi:hypothetical protein
MRFFAFSGNVYHLLYIATYEESITMIEKYRLLGTPTDEDWPGVRELPDYKPNFPQWESQNLKGQVPGLDDLGIDLLKVKNLAVHVTDTKRSNIIE